MFGQRGQVLLIVVLVIIVISTIGLSIATRSITSLRTSTEEAESQKALAAAEAGIERTVQGSVPIELSLQTVLGSKGDPNSSYSTKVDQVNSSKFLINGGNLIPKDEGADVWFIKHNSDNSLDYSASSYCPSPPACSTSPQFLNLFWGSSSDGCGDASVQAIVVARDQVSPYEIKSYRYTYDACSIRRSENHFGSVTSEDNVIDGVSFKYRTPLNDLAGNITPVNSKNIISMRVVPIYKDAAIGVYACNNGNGNCTSLPSQGYKITSTGTSGQASRKLTVFKGYPQTYLPYVSYGLFVAN